MAKMVAQENLFKSAHAEVNELIRESVPINKSRTALLNIDTLSHSAKYHWLLYVPKVAIRVMYISN